MTNDKELTKEQIDQLLINLMEEAAEVIQAASKYLRFGKDSFNDKEKNPESANIRLGKEIGNMISIAGLLSEYHIIHDSDVTFGINKKDAAMVKYGVIDR